MTWWRLAAQKLRCGCTTTGQIHGDSGGRSGCTSGTLRSAYSFCARLVEGKGHQLLLEALRRIDTRRKHDFSVTFVGDGITAGAAQRHR